jgi:formyltetrahydrofolate deformylase
MRVEWSLDEFDLARELFEEQFESIAARFWHELARGAFHYVPVDSDTKNEGRTAAGRTVGASLDRRRRARALHADPFAGLRGALSASHHQRTSFVPSGFHRRQAVSCRLSTGRETHRATSHYVTEALDEGPIIEQGVTRISHRYQLSDLKERGRDVERAVLSRAMRRHLEHRILVYSNRTVVFD